MPNKKPTKKSKPRVASTRKTRTNYFALPRLIAFVVTFAILGTVALFYSRAATYPAYNSTYATADANRIGNYRSSKGFYAFTRKTCLNTIANHQASAEASKHTIFEPSLSWMNSQLNRAAGIVILRSRIWSRHRGEW